MDTGTSRKEEALKQLRDTPPAAPSAPVEPPDVPSWPRWSGTLGGAWEALNENLSHFPNRWTRLDLENGLRVALRQMPSGKRELIVAGIGLLHPSYDETIQAFQVETWEAIPWSDKWRVGVRRREP